MAKNLAKGEECPVILAQNVVAGKWKIPILWLLSDGKKRFNELMRLLPQITHRMLTQQLRELESDGLVSRKIYNEVPPKVEYSLTAIGIDFLPIINLMGEWGSKYFNFTS